MINILPHKVEQYQSPNTKVSPNPVDPSLSIRRWDSRYEKRHGTEDNSSKNSPSWSQRCGSNLGEINLHEEEQPLEMRCQLDKNRGNSSSTGGSDWSHSTETSHGDISEFPWREGVHQQSNSIWYLSMLFRHTLT